MESIEQYSFTNSRGKTYFLNTKIAILRGGKHQQQIFYFSKDLRETSCALPVGYFVVESRNGLPVAKKQH